MSASIGVKVNIMSSNEVMIGDASPAPASALQRSLLGFDVAVQMVELELLHVMNGSHPEFQYHAASIKRHRDRTVADAQRNLAASAVSVAAVFAADLEVVEEDFRQAMAKAREAKAQEVAERIASLELKRDHGNGKHLTRSTRSKAVVKRFGEIDFDHGDDNEVGALAALASFASSRHRRRPLGAAWLLLEKELDEEEVRSDLYEIARDAQLTLHAAGDEGAGDDSDEEFGRGPPRKKFAPAGRPLAASAPPRRSPPPFAAGAPARVGPAAAPKVTAALKPAPAAGGMSHGNGRSQAPNAAGRPTSPGLSTDTVSVLSNLKSGTVTVDGKLFMKGDVVVATVSLAAGGGGGGGGRAGGTSASVGSGPVHGCVSSVNNSEVHLKLTVDGSKHRIYLSHLRNGRVTLEHA